MIEIELLDRPEYAPVEEYRQRGGQLVGVAIELSVQGFSMWAGEVLEFAALCYQASGSECHDRDPE